MPPKPNPGVLDTVIPDPAELAAAVAAARASAPPKAEDHTEESRPLGVPTTPADVDRGRR